ARRRGGGRDGSCRPGHRPPRGQLARGLRRPPARRPRPRRLGGGVRAGGRLGARRRLPSAHARPADGDAAPAQDGRAVRERHPVLAGGTAARHRVPGHELGAPPHRPARPPDARCGRLPGRRRPDRTRLPSRVAARRGRHHLSGPHRVGDRRPDASLAGGGGALSRGLAAPCRLGGARRHRPLPAARRPRRGRRADPRIHRSL
ncbi:MAG: hypothetical protein AVDCRST_MAG65-2254, partial [uncultured Solirubrobacteraceae bacterium]